LSHQQSLAALLCRNSDAFATDPLNPGSDPLDLRFCAVLQHDIDMGDSKQTADTDTPTAIIGTR